MPHDEIRLALPGPLARAKYPVSRPGDAHEQEAERVADRVMRMAEPQVQGDGGTPQPSPSTEATESPLGGPGRPLPESERRYFEPRFGVDFGGVRVHRGVEASAAARSIAAHAFTLGRHIVLDDQSYRSGENTGRRLLAHELAHVVQQGSGVTESPSGAAGVQAVSHTAAPTLQRQRSEPSVEPEERPRPGTQGQDETAATCTLASDMHARRTGSFVGPYDLGDYIRWVADQNRIVPNFWEVDRLGTWNRPGTAGATVQLYGVVPLHCDPGDFTLAQTARITRYKVDGSARRSIDRGEGQMQTVGETVDDLARSGQDYSRAPWRRQFVGPGGWYIAMADIPSLPYPLRGEGETEGADIEYGVTFVSSLIGPAGDRRSAEWRQKIEISNGVVTKNDLIP